MIQMAKLNCSVGDLAIIVKCRIPKNMGNVVRIISAQGFQEWAGHSRLLYTWNVEVASEVSFLHYEGDDGMLAHKTGPAPDGYLRRLTPPKGYLIEEFADSDVLQADLFGQEQESNVLSVEIPINV